MVAVPSWGGGLDNVLAELHQEFDSSLPSNTIDRCFSAEVSKFHDARITSYLNILIHRNARARLRALQTRPASVTPIRP